MVPELWWGEHECVKDSPKLQDIVEDAGRLCDVQVGDCRFAVDVCPWWRVLYVPLCMSMWSGYLMGLSVCQSVGRSVSGVSVFTRAMGVDVSRVRGTVLPSHRSLTCFSGSPSRSRLTSHLRTPQSYHIIYLIGRIVPVIIGQCKRNLDYFSEACFIERVRFNGQMAERSKAPA
jgi:hypothetical protein